MPLDTKQFLSQSWPLFLIKVIKVNQAKSWPLLAFPADALVHDITNEHGIDFVFWLHVYSYLPSDRISILFAISNADEW